MAQEDKELLLKDLCARLQYGVKVKVPDTISINALKIYTIEQKYKSTFYCKRGEWICKFWNDTFSRIEEVKPYLRPLSSMTEEEKVEYCDLQDKFLLSSQYPVTNGYALFDWLDKKMFDFRGLIPKDMAISTEVFNPYKD